MCVPISNVTTSSLSTGPSAIHYNFRGPLLLLNNQFLMASNASKISSLPVLPVAASSAQEKTEPPPPQQQSVVANTPWPQMNQVVLFAGNLLNGNTASSTSLLASRLKNMVVEDLKMGVDVDNAGTGKVDRVRLQQSKLTPATTFLKRWWPGMPTVLVDARDYGCNVTSTSYTSMDTTDEGMATRIATSSTACVQATINAAAKKGGGAAAYFAPGQYAINSTIVVPPGNYTVLGGGYQTQFQWALRAANTTADQAVRGPACYPTRIFVLVKLRGRTMVGWPYHALHCPLFRGELQATPFIYAC